MMTPLSAIVFNGLGVFFPLLVFILWDTLSCPFFSKYSATSAFFIPSGAASKRMMTARMATDQSWSSAGRRFGETPRTLQPWSSLLRTLVISR